MTISKKLAASLAQSFHELCDICEMIHEMQHPFFDLAQRHPEDNESFMKLHELCDFIEPAQDQFTETEGLLRELISGVGMDRDQFAMAALTGMIGDSMEAGNMPTEHHMQLIAEGAYEVADAMMKARKGDKD